MRVGFYIGYVTRNIGHFPPSSGSHFLNSLFHKHTFYNGILLFNQNNVVDKNENVTQSGNICFIPVVMDVSNIFGRKPMVVDFLVAFFLCTFF